MLQKPSIPDDNVDPEQSPDETVVEASDPVDEPIDDTQVDETATKKKAKIPSAYDQERMRDVVEQTCHQYNELLKSYRGRMLRVYEAYSTYEEEKHADWATSFKVNKAHEIVEKILPRIVAKNPRWIVSPRMDNFYPDKPYMYKDPTTGQETQVEDPTSLRDDGRNPNFQQELTQKWAAWVKATDERFKQAEEFCAGIQDYLTYIFDEYDLGRQMRRWAKNMVIYGKGIAKIRYKYETVNLPQGRREDGSIEMTQAVRGEYPTIDVKSWSDVLWDPRYMNFRDMPAVVERVEGVRLGDLKRKKDQYFNLDKLTEIGKLAKSHGANMDEYKAQIQTISGIACPDIEGPLDKNSLTLTYYYGYFEEVEDEDEKIFEICMVGTEKALLFPIKIKEISRIPFEDIDAFEDPEVNQPVGFVEPIISLQDELNFKKNSASEYINNALNRMWLWSSQSGINPKDLVDRPNGIIQTIKSVTEAEANCKEVQMRSIDPAYFNEQSDFERQIQTASFTVDTSNQRSQQALTNTATGIRVAFFESNSVIDEVRKHWEQGIANLAYQLLLETFENMDENIALKKIGQQGFWEIHKELLRDAIIRYSIKVEANSSSFDDIDSRRENAIGFWNVCSGAKKEGVNVDLDEVFKEVILTFEKKDPTKYLKPKSIQQIVSEIMGSQAPAGGGGGGGQQPVPEAPGGAAELTQQVAQGDVVSAAGVK